jgi:transposase
MAPGRARDERKEQQWRRWIDQWRGSGLSVRDFCARHDLASASFYHWRRVLAGRAAEQPAAFVPVQVVADAVPAQASALEVVLVDGRAVRVAPGFDAATLRRLLVVLEGEGSC